MARPTADRAGAEGRPVEIVIAGMRFALDGPGFCAAQARDVAAAVAAFTGMPKADALDAVVEAYSAALDAAAG